MAKTGLKLSLLLLFALRPLASAAGWEELYPGEMWRSVNPAAGGETFLIAYGGYRADAAGAKNWAAALGAAGGFRDIVAVKGPAGLYYEDKEKKKAHELLLKALYAAAPSKIIVSAHSSGAYVAHELLAMLGQKENKALLAKTFYYDLDGMTCEVCRRLYVPAADPGFNYLCVAAAQGALKSPNYESVEACGPGHFTVLELKAGCTGKWCLHGALVNTRAAAINPASPSVPLYYSDPLITPATAYLSAQ